MASFQADGRLFDGNGVHPDVLVEPTPEYYIGGLDNVLAEAVNRLLQGTRREVGEEKRCTSPLTIQP